MTEATRNNYWISPTALHITLNALGNPDYIQGSTSSGAAILCYVKGIIDYDDAHNYRSWSLSLYPTVFASDTQKYVYVAIPRDFTKTQAFVCFPSDKIDIYGRTETTPATPLSSDASQDNPTTPLSGDASPEEPTYTQVGSTDYYYINLQAIISASTGGVNRKFTHAIDFGTLASDMARDTISDSEWYKFDPVSGIVTFIKDLTFQAGQKFLDFAANIADIKEKLILKGSEFIGKAVLPAVFPQTPPDNTIATPKYVDDAAISKAHDDTTTHKLTLADVDVKKLLTLFDELKSNGFIRSMTNGKGWGVDAVGNMQVESIEVRSYMKVLELVYNRLSAEESDFVFTESGTIDKAVQTLAPTVTEEEDGSTVTTGGKYRLTLRKKTETDFTAFHVGDVLRGVVNNLANTAVSVGKDYYTAWMYVTGVDTANNVIQVTRYDDADTPSGKNFPPSELMVLHRWGNNVGANEANANNDEYKSFIVKGDDGKYTNTRQSCWYISSIEKRIVMLDGVHQPILEQSNYAAFFGLPYGMDSFKGKPVNANQPYLYARGAFLQDVFTVDYQGYTHDLSHEFSMRIDTGGDSLIGNGETKRITCSIYDGWGNDVTSGVTRWTVSRNSGDEDEDAAEDSTWNTLHNADEDKEETSGYTTIKYTSFNNGIKDSQGEYIRPPGAIDITLDDLTGKDKVKFIFEATLSDSSQSKVYAELNIE